MRLGHFFKKTLSRYPSSFTHPNHPPQDKKIAPVVQALPLGLQA